MVSKTQIDQLGDRLRKDSFTDSDLRELDKYRRSFGGAYEAVMETIEEAGYSPTGRPAKSTASIVEKLKRESLRLSQMQDIAGCRFVVDRISDQDVAVDKLRDVFSHVWVVDRRARPSHGYRAVHIIVRIAGRPIEIQIRTLLQHRWAEISEKISDIFDPEIKYGRGSPPLIEFLEGSAQEVSDQESAEGRVGVLRSSGRPEHEIRAVEAEVASSRTKMLREFEEAGRILDETWRKKR